MIMLTKFNSKTNKKGEFVLNAEIIESIEETPDTVVTLTNGKKLIVEEPMEEIVRRTIKYRRALHQNSLANFHSFGIMERTVFLYVARECPGVEPLRLRSHF